MNSNIKKNVLTIQEMFSQWISKQVYIIWDKEGLPIIQTDFECVIKYIDEVLAVSFETWVVAEDMNQFIQCSESAPSPFLFPFLILLPDWISPNHLILTG